MRGSKPVHTYHDQNIIYTVYDNGAVFAGAKHGNVKKIWCVSPPKNAGAVRYEPELLGKNATTYVDGNIHNSLISLSDSSVNTKNYDQRRTQTDIFKPATKLTQATKELLREQKNVEFCNKLLSESNEIKSLFAHCDAESVKELIHLSIQCKDILINEKLAIAPEIFRELELLSGPLSEINTDPRWREFKVDVANGFKSSLKKIKEEAIPAWLCEKKKLTGHLYRFTEPEGRTDFIEHTSEGIIKWDVKTYPSRIRNGRYIFNLENCLTSIKKGLQSGENLIIDTTRTELADCLKLLQEIKDKLNPDELNRIIIVDLVRENFCNKIKNISL